MGDHDAAIIAVQTILAARAFRLSRRQMFAIGRAALCSKYQGPQLLTLPSKGYTVAKNNEFIARAAIAARAGFVILFLSEHDHATLLSLAPAPRNEREDLHTDNYTMVELQQLRHAFAGSQRLRCYRVKQDRLRVRLSYRTLHEGDDISDVFWRWIDGAFQKAPPKQPTAVSS